MQIELFRRLDRELWHEVYHNPVKLLGTIDQKKLAEAAANDSYLAQLQRVYQSFKNHLSELGWYQKNHADVAAGAKPVSRGLFFRD